MAEEQEKKKKFSPTEIILITPVVLLVDALTLIANLAAAIPVIGEITEVGGSFMAGAIMFLVQFYLLMKGTKNLSFLIGGVLDMIPFLNMLPTQTIGWIAVVIMENNPKLKKIAGKVDKTGVGKIAGKL